MPYLIDSYHCGPRIRRAFTLIELLTVIAIIAILASIIVVIVGQARATAQAASCGSNLRQLTMASLLYANDHKDQLPRDWEPPGPGVVSMVWNDRLNEYIGLESRSINYESRYYQSNVWFCPGTPILNNNKDNRHYGLNTYIRASEVHWNFSITIIPVPSRIVLIGEKNSNTDFVYPDGRVGGISNDPTVESGYRVSHKSGTGANYGFADGHVEYHRGFLSDINPNTSRWKWW